ncbi:hypothetical protein SAMN03159341_12046 [Paenibacillus sp. 1_12]|uniref:hypothetical protein n=1 Tax=Paenibacillus sp. 1_12 TaxID=1566278 RepID=UPI0008E924DC|nr:hypothetical protein [Paenibacillus sp. 1_12]SFM20340.1 hypothetical protein SAMN03159341_12046 [Paenibacillus sp. 1_12]
MTTPLTTKLTQAWVDDYLDLYNYAKYIGDTEWQQQITEALSNKESIIQNHVLEMQEKLKQDLWKMFDTVNRNMLQIYEELRKSQDVKQVEDLRQQVWELKTQRIELSRKIRRS